MWYNTIRIYNWSTYIWCQGSVTTITKYNTDSYFGSVDNKIQLELSDDAASVICGDAWRMPTDAELTELKNNCIWTWVNQNGVNGYRVTGSNGNCIFLPAAGYYYNSSIKENDCIGYYLSSSLCTYQTNGACMMIFDSSRVSCFMDGRHIGASIRPVYQYNK